MFAEAAAVPLTSVAQPRQLIGRTAAEMLIEEARERGGAHEHRQVVFDARSWWYAHPVGSDQLNGVA